MLLAREPLSRWKSAAEPDYPVLSAEFKIVIHVPMNIMVARLGNVLQLSKRLLFRSRSPWEALNSIQTALIDFCGR